MQHRSGIDRRFRECDEQRCLLVGQGEAWHGFASRLEPELDVERCADAREAAYFLRSARYRSMVFDWSSRDAGPDATELCRLVRDVSPEVGLFAATAPSAVADRVLALEAGVDDCVTYEIEVQEFLARVRAATRRKLPRTPTRRPDYLQDRARALADAHRLSGREQETLLLLARGTHLKQIAAVVGCSYATIRTHLRRLCRKLGCSGTREAIILFFAYDTSSLSCTQSEDCRSGTMIR